MDTVTIVGNRITALSNLYTRMDSTRARLYNESYTLKGVDGKALKNVISVTAPFASIFVNTVVNDLMEAVRQTVVEGNISATQTTTIERFIDDTRAQIDEQLTNSSFHTTLNEWWCSHVCVRSYIGARYISQIKDGRYQINCLPVDMRWCPFEYGNDGLNWASNITFRSPAQLNIEYPDKSFGGTDDLVVWDYWDGDKNEVYVGTSLTTMGGEPIRQQKNRYGYPPFVISAPATGFMLRDKGWIEHDSEDLIFLLRDLYDEINRSFSIEQTKAQEVIEPRSQDIVRKGEMDSSPAVSPPEIGETVKREEGLPIQYLETPDLSNAFLTARADLLKLLQMGGLNDIDLGNVSQTVSAVWITAQSGIRKKFSNPRLKAIAHAETLLSRMMIDQYQKVGKGDMEIGSKGKKRRYNPSQLGNPDTYTVTHRLMSYDKLQELANLAQFEAARDLPMKWKLTNILKVNDPEGVLREMDLEAAKRADPVISLFEMARKYAQEGKNAADENGANALLLQSMLLTERCVSILKQRMQPVQPELPEGARVPEVEEPGGNGNLLASMPKVLSMGQQTRQAEKKQVIQGG